MSTTTTSTELLSKQMQTNVSAMGGVLVANKPVTGGRLADGRTSSALFYWSHSHFTENFEFGLHDHQGFEIITVILEGSNSHYDTATRRWADLVAGDVQIIQSGSGVSHNERVAKGARAFQIWFDPDFYSALKRPATYVDHTSKEFPREVHDGYTVIPIAGPGGPVNASTPGLIMQRVQVSPFAQATLPLALDHRAFCYVIEGSARINDSLAERDDLVTTARNPDLTIAAGARPADIFIITLPENPSYTPVLGR